MKTVLFRSDIIVSNASFLNCKDLVKLSLVSKQAAAVVKEVALYMLNSSHTRYGGEMDLSALQQLHVLRSPIGFHDLFGDRIGYLDEDRACAYSSNPNTLPTYVVPSICIKE